MTSKEGEEFSADPGHVGCFGVLVDGVGRGLPRAVACGKEFTLVSTYPYEGPIMEVRPTRDATSVRPVHPGESIFRLRSSVACRWCVV